MNANTCPKHWHKKEWWLTCPTCPNTAPDDDYFGIGTGYVQSESNKDTVITATPGEAKAASEEADTLENTGIPGKSGDTTPDSFEREVWTAMDLADPMHPREHWRHSHAVNHIVQAHNAALLAELEALHRVHGRQVDNLTDEAIDDRIAALEADK